MYISFYCHFILASINCLFFNDYSQFATVPKAESAQSLFTATINMQGGNFLA